VTHSLQWKNRIDFVIVRLSNEQEFKNTFTILKINLIKLFLVFFSAATIIIADALIKKISDGNSFFSIIRDPWMILICGLYLVQIFAAIFVFISKGELAIYTNLFIIFYGIFGIVIGVLFFKENISTVQMIGIGFGLLGAVLMNI